ncbi:MAG: FAD-dependent monooxygenase, partial [Bacteroidales bacterium]
MIDEIQIRMPVALLLGEQKELLLKKEVAHILSLAVESISYVEILKLSLDTRSVRPFYQLSLKIYTLPDTYSFPTYEIQIPKLEHKAKVLICGCGPAGLFAALTLAKEGLCPVIIERGKTIKERKKDIALLCREGYLNPNSNYCFGEGGAGCFSDGKLYTRSNKRGDVHQVLETLVGFGADPEILYQAHPHLGSDKLPGIMERIRLALIHSGAEFHFETCVEEILVSNGKCTGVRDTKGNDFLGEALILACGHSARNIYEWLDKNNYKIEAKAFALGVRLEHPQALINAIQY